MALIDYPRSLPRPQASIVTPAERRQLSDDQRPRFARALQRDRREFEQLTWPPMSAQQIEAFQEWWQTDLSLGGAWFNATWPLPRGFVEAVRKFTKPPQRAYLGKGFWRMTAVCEVRGRSLPVNRDPGLIAQWNTTNEIGTIAFSNADLTAASSTSNSLCVDNYGLGSGKYYGEIEIAFDIDEGPGINVQLGVTLDEPGNSDNGIGYGVNGDLTINGVVTDTLAPLLTGDVVGLAVDTATNQVWISVNGTWISGNPALGTGESAVLAGGATYFMFFFLDSIETTYEATLATSNAQFQYTRPSGFSPWAS